MKRIIVIVFFILLNKLCLAQAEATLLVITSVDSQIFVDGIDKGRAKAGVAFRIVTLEGEHYVEAIQEGSQVKGETIQLEAGKQKIHRIEFDNNINTLSLPPVLIADINFNVPGQLEVLAWQNTNKGMNYPYPEFYYAFDKGDEVFIDINMSNIKGTNSISVATYPQGVIRYTNNAFVELRNVGFKVPERSIYKFTIATNHAFARNCYIKVWRKASSKETEAFNPNVSLQKVLTPVVVTEPQNFRINGGLNASLAGGKSRVVLPLKLPPNTIEWVYRFSASRNTEDINNIKQNLKLFSELSALLFELTGPIASAGTMAINKLAQPPGADFCDIFLLPTEYGPLFEAKRDDQWKAYQDASRKNFMSGNVKVSCCNEGSFLLGLRNPDSTFPINVVIEVVAITAKDEYVMENNK